MNIDNIGTKIDSIPVTISYKIIQLFSAGLYSSPNKAFEELVSNSYDAGASKVSVYVPMDKNLPDAVLWVADNGLSMDREGLKQFWKIGESQKRESVNSVNQARLPIGKFGIGKLATYILTQKLTLICKANDGKFYGVTMNYSSIHADSSESIFLDEKELALEEVKKLLSPLIKKNQQNLISFNLWGEDAERTWTFAILSELKPKVSEIKDGRLRWVLSTALPLNPNFDLTFNGSPIQPSKANIEPWHTWFFGIEDDIAINEKYNYEIGQYAGQACVHLPNLKNVVGKIDLYRDSLLTGKSEELGRSNGIFLTIRGRLINIDDPLIGMEAFSHGVFNRIRITINADELDDYITSTRESLQSSPALDSLKEYIKRKFNHVKEWYFAQIESEEKQNTASYKIASGSSSLFRRPLIVAAKNFLEGNLDDLMLTEIPKNLTEKEKKEFIAHLDDNLISEKGIIQSVKWVALSPEDPIAKLNLSTQVANINLMHPFFANFLEDVKSTLPFQLIALTEILTECLLLDSGIAQSKVKDIMQQRDAILRELTFSDKPNVPFVASLLMNSLGNPTDLETNVTHAFNLLGYESNRISGNGKPDGIAYAHLGHRNSQDNYSITFDAKSTAKGKIKAATAHLAGVVRHKNDYRANFACVVAIDFEGSDDPNSAVNKEAKHLKVSLIKAYDLLRLILLASPKQVGLRELREFFDTNHTVIETSAWINGLESKKIEREPIKELLEAVYNLMKSDTEPPHLGAVRMSDPELKKYSMSKLKAIIESLEKLVPHCIKISSDDIISMNLPPNKIMDTLNQITSSNHIPVEFREIYLSAFTTKSK